jgi:hypothetical protein
MADVRVVTESLKGMESIPVGEIKQGHVVVGSFSSQEKPQLWLCVREYAGRGSLALFLGMDKYGRITGPLRDTYSAYGTWQLVSADNRLEPCNGSTYQV